MSFNVSIPVIFSSEKFQMYSLFDLRVSLSFYRRIHKYHPAVCAVISGADPIYSPPKCTVELLPNDIINYSAQ